MKKLREITRNVALAGVPFGVILFLITHWRYGAGGDSGIQHWLAIHSGTDNEPGVYYGFFSGSGSDLGEYVIATSLLTAIVTAYRKHNCHTDRCWRISRFPLAGGQYSVCRKCHREVHGHPPDHKITIDFLRTEHEKHLHK